MKFLHLIVPLPGQLERIQQIASRVAPSLLKLLRRGDALKPATGYSATLCAAFGITPQQDWPMAPICAAAEGLSANDYWLRLDPVHLEVGMGGLLMHPPGNLNLSLPEAHALIADINRHWHDQRLAIQAVSPTRWYLHLNEAPNLHTTPIDQMVGEYLTPCLPRGADARPYLKLINEVQMLMHTHPVNLARENAGQPAVNGLWLWGGGRLPTCKSTFDLVAADGFEAQALARLAGCRYAPPPNALSDLDASGRALVALAPADAHGDIESTLAKLEQDWFRPALRQLAWGRIQRLRLDLIGQRAVSLTPAQTWRFWR